MSLIRKLKPDRNITGALIIPFSIVPIFGLATLIFGLTHRVDRPGDLDVGLFPFLSVCIYAHVEHMPNWLLCIEGVFFGFMFLVLLSQTFGGLNT